MHQAEGVQARQGSQNAPHEALNDLRITSFRAFDRAVQHIVLQACWKCSKRPLQPPSHMRLALAPAGHMATLLQLEEPHAALCMDH